jgi:hypothetical protein
LPLAVPLLVPLPLTLTTKSEYLLSHVPLIRQEYENGAKLYLGGLEAAELVCGENICGINVLVETRDGLSENRTRHKRPHRLIVPHHIDRIKIPATRLSSLVVSRLYAAAYDPLFKALSEGKQVLVHCANGQHRSAKTVTDVVASSYQDCGESGRLVHKMRVLSGVKAPLVIPPSDVQTHILQATLAEHCPGRG